MLLGIDLDLATEIMLKIVKGNEEGSCMTCPTSILPFSW